MKHLKTTTAVLIFSLLITPALAQDFVFRVLANNGDNQLKVPGQEDSWRALKTGEKLKADDEIKVVGEAYLGLIHHSGKTLEIKKAGNYRAEELASQLKQGASSVMGKYADFLISKISEEEEDVVKDYKKYQNATGAVKRALSKATALKVLMPQTSTVMGPQVTLRWIEAGLAKPPVYLVTLKNEFSQTIKTVKTREPFITLDLREDVFKKQELVIFDVQVVGKKRYKSDEYGIKRMAGDNSDQIKEELATFAGKNGNDQAMSHLLKAMFFEEKNLPLDAITAYEKAIALEPEVAEFKLLYSRFITSQKF